MSHANYRNTCFRPYLAKAELRKLPIVAIIYDPVYSYARRWLLGDTPKSLKALAGEFADAAWYGIRAT